MLTIAAWAAVLMLAGCRSSADKLYEQVKGNVPQYAVMAHRGSTYWAPEETESAWRWAREIGADYLESDLQCTKDGIILANHDVNLTRTTDIEEVFGDGVPEGRKAFYMSLGFSEEDADAQLVRDKASFVPHHAASYYYAELLMLDAGKWFNEACPDRARSSYEGSQYVSALQDQIAYAEGKRLRRGPDGRRILPYALKTSGKTLAEISTEGAEDGKYMEFLHYDFENAYENDPADGGNRPGIYIEFKEPEVNPTDMEQRVFDVLDAAGWNIITKPATDKDFYKDGKVNVGRTAGKVILQTFSPESLQRANAIFKGRLPMCYLLWPPCPDSIDGGDLDTEEGFRTILRWARENGADIIGPSISGEPNNYDELNQDWQAALVHEAGMLDHPYSFDSPEQMETQAVRSDGFFTNRSEMTISYLATHGMRSRKAPEVPDAEETLVRLGY